MNIVIEGMLRSLLSFSILLFVTRIVGKKQLGQLNIFTYITGIVVGNMASEMIVRKEMPIIEGIVGIVSWSLLVILVEYISIKSVKARGILNGSPSIVIRKGKIVEKTLKHLRLNVDDLTMLLRTNKVFSILDVDYAILEANGDLSVLKKTEKEVVTKEDMKIKTGSKSAIPIEVIVDGTVLYKNLNDAGFSKQWLDEQLQQHNVTSKNVLYSEVQADGAIYIQKKEN